MFAAYLGLTVVFVAAIALVLASASRRLHRVQRATGGPSARPAPQAAGRAAVPAVRVQSSSAMTGPYAYDDDAMAGIPDEEGES